MQTLDILAALHWLTDHFKIDRTAGILKTWHGQAPAYICRLFTPYQPDSFFFNGILPIISLLFHLFNFIFILFYINHLLLLSLFSYCIATCHIVLKSATYKEVYSREETLFSATISKHQIK